MTTRYFVPRCFDVHWNAPPLNWRNCLLDVWMFLDWTTCVCGILKAHRSHAVTPRYADWIMVKKASNQRGANSVTALSTRNPSRGCFSLRKLYFGKLFGGYHLDLKWIFDWMPGEEASTLQFIWCSIWKPGDSNFCSWVKICLVLGSQKWAFHPWLLLITCRVNAKPIKSFKFTVL